MDLQRISDELEITTLLTRYARAVDTKDWDLYRSVFTDDAHIDYSSAGAIARSREQGAHPLARGGSPRFRCRCITSPTSKARSTATPPRCARCSTTPCSCRG